MKNIQNRYELQIYYTEFDRGNIGISEYQYCNSLSESIEESKELIEPYACVEVVDTMTKEVMFIFSRDIVSKEYYFDALLLEK